MIAAALLEEMWESALVLVCAVAVIVAVSLWTVYLDRRDRVEAAERRESRVRLMRELDRHGTYRGAPRRDR